MTSGEATARETADTSGGAGSDVEPTRSGKLVDARTAGVDGSCDVESGSRLPGMGRRAFLRRTMWGFALAGGGLPHSAWGRSPGRVREVRAGTSEPEVRGAARRLQLPGTLRARAFGSASGEDAGYHALVHEGGAAAAKALLTTPVSDLEVARRLRALGAHDGGGVPMAAWNLRHLPLVRAPATRVAGTPIRILAEWEGWESPRDFSALVRDPGGRGVAFRFGGNEEHDPLWESGCIACLFSCPGGVISNERYTVRDHVRGVTDFSPAVDLPEADTPVTVTIEFIV